MADFRQMGAVPDFYSQILNSARQGLVQLPDGSFVPSPQMGQGTSVADFYRGILPGPSDPVGAGPGSYGTMQGFAFDPSYGGQGLPQSQPLTRDNMWFTANVPGNLRGSGSAGGAFGQGGQAGFQGQPMQTATAPTPRNRPLFPLSVDGMGRFNPPPKPFMTADASEPRLTAGTGLAFAGDQPVADGIAAINGATGVPLPRPRPNLAPQPRPRPMGIAPGGLASYTIRKGDTLSAISRRTGIPVNTLAQMNNISDPNRIMAGQNLNLGAGMMSPPPQQTSGRPSIAQTLSQPQGRPLMFTDIKDAGKAIRTENNGTQLIGMRLNNSPRGRTVTNDDWFNSVTGRS